MLIAEGQVCMNERSRFDRNKASVTDLKLTAWYTDTKEECAQYCKSISNRFSFGKSNKECYCHTGTREAGRCKLESNANFDLYEFRYPGKFFNTLLFKWRCHLDFSYCFKISNILKLLHLYCRLQIYWINWCTNTNWWR